MARKLRVEYPGAIYHVMNRGDRREPIFKDDADRQRFMATLAEACTKTGWQVHALCLMPNHFHLVVETPRAILVLGMKWLLAYTSRFNRRHKLFGHLFSRRYKSAHRGWQRQWFSAHQQPRRWVELLGGTLGNVVDDGLDQDCAAMRLERRFDRAQNFQCVHGPLLIALLQVGHHLLCAPVSRNVISALTLCRASGNRFAL